MSNQSTDEEISGIINYEAEEKYNSVKEESTVGKGYFGGHPRVLLTIPIFLFFVYQGIGFIIAEMGDVVSFFHNVPLTWSALFLILIFGSFLLGLLFAPIAICFYSIEGLYQINISDYTPGKKFLYSIGIILLVLFGTSIIRLFTLGGVSIFI